jgi:hypothetical protein
MTLMMGTTFTVASVMTLILPIALVIALITWYMRTALNLPSPTLTIGEPQKVEHPALTAAAPAPEAPLEGEVPAGEIQYPAPGEEHDPGDDPVAPLEDATDQPSGDA